MQSHLAFENYLGRRVHLGVCGSIAAYKAIEVMRLLLGCKAHVSATLTDSACKFIQPLSFEALGAAPVYSDMFDSRDAVFGHLDPGQDADAFLIAPATANTIAKLAQGLASDMLSAQALAFPGPVVVAPAMNPRLWNAPATKSNWELLKQRGVVCMEPGCGDMACGEEGKGRFPEPWRIALATLKALTAQDMQGKKVLITLGPTRESFDVVRYWTNPSSGTMGASLAVAAWLRGADVTAVCGPVSLDLPEGINRIDVATALEMHDAVSDCFSSSDISICTAAVADFRPRVHEGGKFKKSGADGLTVEFDTNPDILKGLGERKRSDQFLAGFAAESSSIEANAAGKLQRKNLDLIVGNDVTAAGCGFGSSTNGVFVQDAKGRSETWPVLPKTEVAWRILDWISAL